MNKKITLVSAVAVALAGVYLGGVFYTGQKVEQYGDDLGRHVVEYVSKSGNFNNVYILKDFFKKNRLIYVRDTGGLFSESGNILLEMANGKRLALPVAIDKGFGSLHVDLDLASTLKNLDAAALSLPEPPPLDFKTVSGFAKINVSLLFAKSAYDIDYSVKYKDKHLDDLAIKATGSSNKDESLNEFSLMNLFTEEISMGSYTLSSTTDRQAKNKLMPGPVTIEIKDLYSDRQQIAGAFKAKFKSTDPDSLGNFALNVEACASDLFSKNDDLSFNLTVSSFNNQDWLSYYSLLGDLNHVADLEKIVSLMKNRLNHLELKSLVLTLSQASSELLLGVKTASDLKLQGQGSLDFNLDDFYDLNGSFDVTSSSMQGLETLFTERNGKYESKVELINGRLLINGHYF